MLGGEIPRLRFAALRMTCGGEEVGWAPASARTTGGAGRAVREQPLPDGCQTGRRDGSPHPREQRGGSGTGGSRTSPYQMVVRRVGGMGPRIREDNGGSGTGCSPKAPTRWLSDGWEGWVPASARTTGGADGLFAKSPTRWLSDGWEERVPASARTTGERDGLFAKSPYQMVVRRVAGMGPRIREDNGGGSGNGAVRQKPLPDGCQTGGRDGSLCSVHPPHF